MLLRKNLNESYIGRKVNGSTVGRAFQAFTDKVGSYVSELFTSESHKEQVAWKQGLLDLLDKMERDAVAFNTQLALKGKVLTPEGIVMVRPDLAYPEIYSTSPKDLLEEKFGNTSINDLYTKDLYK